MTTSAKDVFDGFYQAGAPPWVIGEPQPAIVALERTGVISGRVLDAGCGTGEHTILLAALDYDVLGIDFAPNAIDQARANAAAKGVDARFEVADAMKLDSEPGYDTVVDSALFHIFGDPPTGRVTSRACTERSGPAGCCICSRSPTQVAASVRWSARRRSAMRSSTGGSSRRSTPPRTAGPSAKCTAQRWGSRWARRSTNPPGWRGSGAAERLLELIARM